MKIISGFFKSIAFVLMAIFILFLPFSLFAREVGQTLYNPIELIEVVKNEVMDPDILANIVEVLIKENEEFQAAQGDNLFANVLLQGVFNLDHEEWVSIINFVAPPEIVSDAFDQILDSYYRWIDGRSPVPLIQVSLIPWKNSIKTNTIPILELIMRDIPACNPEEIQTYNLIRLSGDYTDLPSCRPPEPNYSWILDTGAIEAPEFLDTSLPKNIDNSKALLASTEDPIVFKENYLNMVAVMRGGWILLVALFIVAIPLGVRSIPDLFKWGGWPLLLAGAWGLLISILLLFFTGSLLAIIGRLVSGSIPPAAFNQIELMGEPLVQYFQRSFMVQSAVIFGIGCIFLIIGSILGRTMTKKPVASPQPAPTVQKKQENKKDESSPTGMFG
jgi:hypothetical protein